MIPEFTSYVSLKLPPSLRASLDDAAKWEQISVSAYVRRLIAREAMRSLQDARMEHEETASGPDAA